MCLTDKWGSVFFFSFKNRETGDGSKRPVSGAGEDKDWLFKTREVVVQEHLWRK